MPSQIDRAAASRGVRTPAATPKDSGGGAWRSLAGLPVAVLAWTAPCLAQEAGAPTEFGMTPHETLMLALLALAVGFGMLTLVWLLRQQSLTEGENRDLRAAVDELRGQAERSAALLAGDDQRVVVYSAGALPSVQGMLPFASGAPADPRRFLDFESWLPAETARRLDAAVGQLKDRAETFRMILGVPNGSPVEACGRAIGADAVVRFSALGGLREELALLRADHARGQATIGTMQALCDDLPMPVWLRDGERRLSWVNRAYAASVDADDAAAAIASQAEFLGEQDRSAVAAAVAEKGAASERLSTVVDADRRNFHVVEAAGPAGSAGVAIDVSETEAVRMELRQTIRSHSETLDQLTTAIAKFDDKTQLVYHNAAFGKLFGLSAVYLDARPDQVSMMDHLRSKGVLPEDRPLRELKNEILAAYRATEPTETLWHLSDGRTLRVFAAPAPQGGATWIFEDLTEKLELESRLNVLVRLQGETLDYLNEAVSVFGPDGRLRLSNPSFAELWGLSDEFVQAKPHIKAIGKAVDVTILPPEDGSDSPGIDWGGFIRAVTAFAEGERRNQTGEFRLSDGRVQSYGIVPLPNGQTMLTFSDITDARAAERMLRERNDALEMADRVKTDFVKHVNYELRSPLTNIIGFSALLRASETGPLTERQAEYLDYISTSTAALMTIVNDILDLASIDAGTMDLEISEVEIAKVAEKAMEGLADRLRENDLTVAVDVARAGRSFFADEHRVVQVLFNLLSNAANFAPAGTAIDLTAERDGSDLVFAVRDRGPGIAPGQLDRIFERFEADPVGGRHSGAGLGLSIVKSFVELHRGTVEVRSNREDGTTVVCRLPFEGRAILSDAAE
ncbi:sensor histidine kinase [Aureimonas leprariae]|uniref:histidine kinase n=1 Tax=Plantimonas leprariae TaxID=2615207 RepID=A0A7V7TYE0_9HYPH|nr:PAS domain-containing sensor histidine kinase [Aureimonas leprariae]KAB0682892.1 histidine kinase [Aureimonas leprariae]